MTDLSKFIPDLSAVCTLYSSLLSGKSISCEETLSLVTFYNSFPSVHDVESGIMDLVFNAPVERKEIIIKSLHTDLDTIVRLYRDNSQFFEQKDLRLLWHTPLSFVEKDIETQLKKTQEASYELREASNSYEMTPFNGMSEEETAILERRVDKLTAQYHKEKAKLQTLYDKCKSLEEEMQSVPSELFRLVYIKCVDLLPVIDKYYNVPIEKDKAQSDPVDLYLSMSLIASIHELCNGRQFEDVSPIDLFHALNLQQTSKPLVVCKNEKVRVCYLINQISEKIDKDKRGEWIEAMLRITGIEQDYYRSKYREPLSDIPSKKNKEFAETLKEILG